MGRLAVVMGCAAIALSSGASLASAQAAGPEEAARTITAADLAARVGVMAHDSMQGRATPSSGLDRTAEWIATEFRRLGLRGGAADGSFVQRYPLDVRRLDLARSFLSGPTARLRFGEDLLPLSGEVVEGDAGGEIVLVSGSGRVNLGIRRTVRDRHVVVIPGAGVEYLDREVFRVVTTLRSAGALSVMVADASSDEAWAQTGRNALSGSVSPGWGDAASTPPFAPLLRIRSEALERLLAGRDVDLAALRARGAEELRADQPGAFWVTLVQRLRDDQPTGPNVVGILEGSDPVLRDEYVAFSAHMDHIGMTEPDARGDSIFNGADDDASGTAAVMAVAEAMASLEPRPRRSMVFLIVSGEEKGLWGSEWYVENPSVPLEATVAALNADMVGRNWTDTIVAIGKEHSDLGATLERVNRTHPELEMTAIDDLWPGERFYFRSDHYNFARHGVPILFFFNGTHEDYHGLDDEPERIDAEKAARIGRLLFWLGLEISETDARPQWNPESYDRIVTEGR